MIAVARTILFIASLLSAGVFAATKNGFVLDNSLIPESEILHGGPPRDGIPAIHDPLFIPAGEADFLEADDRVLGLEIDGQAKVYPVQILNWHEVVNDSSGGMDFSVTYCPLCGTGIAFSGTDVSAGIRFGVSGLLYNSDVLLYDLSTESLWSQILGMAISGERSGERLVKLPLEHTTWEAWRDKHPKSLVLSRKTGFSRDYNHDPYEGYARSARLYFPISENLPALYHPKEHVIGLTLDGQHIAFPFVELNQHDQPVIEGKLGNRIYRVLWNQAHQSAVIVDENGEMIPVVQAFWFAWYTFHPETTVFKATSR